MSTEAKLKNSYQLKQLCGEIFCLIQCAVNITNVIIDHSTLLLSIH